MKRLWLLRHAKAEPATDPLTDIGRPLAARGIGDAVTIGARLQRHRMRPALMVASPAARALHTAQLVADAVDYPRENIVLEQRLYLAAPGTIVDIITAQSATVEALLVVGHNPGLSELVQELSPTFDVDDLPTAAIVGLEYPGALAWTDIEHADPTVAYYDFPKNTGSAVTRR